MTNQEIFNRVCVHLYEQGEPSVDMREPLFTCRYRRTIGDRVLRCSVGCLIEDDHYRPELEGQDCGTSAVCCALEKSLGMRCDFLSDAEGLETRYLLVELQRAHDGESREVKRSKKWKEDGATLHHRLLAIAERFCLNSDVLNAAYERHRQAD